MDTISGNIFGYGKNGHRAKRWGFSDFVNGGQFHDAGYDMHQGKQEPRIGEWTKMMIRGRGFFNVVNNRTGEAMYTRLGDFHLNGQGDMVTREGFKVQGLPLYGNATKLRGPDTRNPNYEQTIGDSAYLNPYHNPLTETSQQLNPPGRIVGNNQDINLSIDPVNGKYLGKFDSIKVDEDGIIYGKAGHSLVSLYKLSVVNFNNPEGLKNAKDDIYFSANRESGVPSMFSADSIVISEALEKSNAWIKVEAHKLSEAQRYFQAATQVHKLSDKISGTAIEMIQ